MESRALQAMAEAVGAEYVDTRFTTLQLAQTATFPTRQRVAAIVRPANRDEVQRCVRLANAYSAPIYPISRGKNWGYGSRVPTADGAILVSLDRLDQIVEYHEQLAYVTVQPGVTFRQLNTFLQTQHSRLYLNAPGSTPDASVIGNTVERGIVQGVQPDRVAHICALEVVLPNGECIQTGMAALPQNQAAPVQQWGLGPALDGIFLQSNLGIVTRMTLWLESLPAYYCHFHFSLPQSNQLEGLLETLQQLQREGVITTSIGLHNDYKIISLQTQYPFEAAQGQRPLPSHLRQALIDAVGGGSWFGEAAFHAPSLDILFALQRRIVARLAPQVSEFHLSDVNAPGPFFSPDTESSLVNVYWRKTTPPTPEADPDRDRCGVIWYSPVLPFTSESVDQCIRCVEQILPAYGFEPILSFQIINARCIYAIVSILYDRSVEDEDHQAIGCYHALVGALRAGGFYPYRLGLLSQEQPPSSEQSYRNLLHTLKRTIDPNGILAPGRYDFGASQL